MRRALRLVVCAVGIGACGAASAAARTPFQIRCEDSISKTLSVLSAKTSGFTINNQIPYRGLTVRSGSAARNMATLGLTVTQGQYAATIGGPVLQDPASGYECIAPQVEIKLHYSPVKIYVASEFPPGTCAYDVILAHEQRHLQAYMENLARVEKVVREALVKRFGDRPLYAQSGTALGQLENEINSVWFPFIRDEFEKGKAEQERIDAPEEYARLGRECDGEIARVVQRRRTR